MEKDQLVLISSMSNSLPQIVYNIANLIESNNTVVPKRKNGTIKSGNHMIYKYLQYNFNKRMG